MRFFTFRNLSTYIPSFREIYFPLPASTYSLLVDFFYVERFFAGFGRTGGSDYKVSEKTAYKVQVSTFWADCKVQVRQNGLPIRYK